MKNKLLRLVPLIFFLSLIGLNAATINVPDSVSTLQAAVDSATAGDTIFIQGSYTHNGLLTTIDKDLTINGNNQSIDGGFDIEDGAEVTINNLTIENIPTSDLSGFSSKSSGSETIMVSVVNGTLNADGLILTHTQTTSGVKINLVGVNVTGNGTLNMTNSKLNLTNESLIYGIYGQSGGPTINVNNNTLIGEISATTIVGRNIHFIGHQIKSDNTYAHITNIDNTYDITFSEDDQRFFEVLLYADGSTLPDGDINTYIDGFLTTGEYARVYYTGSGYMVYGVENIIDVASPGDTLSLPAGTYSAFDIDSDSVTILGASGVYISNGSPAVTVNANDVTIDGMSFNFNSATDYAIKVSGDYYGIVVKNCNFLNTDGGGSDPGFGIDNETNTTGLYYVDATENNDWNDTGNKGPFQATSNPSGDGVTVTDYVIYEWDGLVNPIHSVSGVSVIPTFEWEKVGTSPAPNYKLVVSKNANLSSPIYTKEVGTDTTITIIDTVANFPLDNNFPYYWTVEVHDDNGFIFAPDTNYFYTVDGVNISVGNPGDGTDVYQYDPLQFSWYLSQAQGSLKFFLQVKDTNAAPGGYEWENFSDIEYDDIGNTYRSVNGLFGGTNYYWRVIAYHDNGAVSTGDFGWDDTIVKFSSNWEFTTKGGAVKAYPSWPIGGNTVWTLEPTFYWYTMQWEPSTEYTVLYSKSNSTTSSVLDTDVETISAGTNTYVNVGTTLDASTTYYWQIKSTYSGAENYSSVASFKTYDAPGLVATAATLTHPIGGIDVYSTSPTFYWYIEGYNSTGITYTVEVDDDNAFGSIDHTFSTTSMYVQGSGLTPGETYYWRVQAYDGTNTVPSANIGEFSVVGGAGSYPVASYPVSNATVWTNTPTLSWYMEGSTLGWDHYVVAWSTTNKLQADWKTQMIAGDSTASTGDMTETFYTFTSDLEYGETYYWAVAAYDVSASAYSSVGEGSFTVAGGNATVALTNPANNSTSVSKTPTFYWYVSNSSLGIDKYMVEYSKTELFTAFIDSVETTNTYASVSSSLEGGATYWWRVYVSYDAGATWNLASSKWQFTVDAGASAVMPLVGSPANGEPLNTSSPILSWYLPAQSESTLSYEVEVADNPEFANVEVYDNISQLNAQVSELEEGEYYWRVRSKADGSTSSYSNTGNFKVGDGVTSVEDEEMPLTYDIDQNYPNPFNPTTTINYAIPEANYVSIKIYNMLGQEVKTLVNKDVKAGRHTIEWRGENNYGQKVSSGTYIYRITAGEYTQAKKMILLK